MTHWQAVQAPWMRLKHQCICQETHEVLMGSSRAKGGPFARYLPAPRVWGLRCPSGPTTSLSAICLPVTIWLRW